MVAVFLVGYFCIAMEHKLEVNKAATALLTGGILWALYIVTSPLVVPQMDGEAFNEFLANNPSLAGLPLVEQCVRFISGVQIVDHLGEISETLFFLIGAMTIVELIDVHGGFSIITNRPIRSTTRSPSEATCPSSVSIRLSRPTASRKSSRSISSACKPTFGRNTSRPSPRWNTWKCRA